ncbi:capsular exopolysaccharide family [Hymenobacter roseosalivarius DSM 11622]|uniref:non-specific protein-tyrosine kinase n=1 Tax=Hymenobacter roseosalivarius DSM 11622 TaxID=645990 RepID=A0A1W1VRL3_9BACT|nr:polysaccharide biosynthesis tyrosine autokinase [Hymenobacter roseosalivarius]SMB95988.1 capsular exopolysaccharide family [Hymenobacter roseosalivarius DSM 11622]
MAAKEETELEELIRNANGIETEDKEDEGDGLDITTLLQVARKSLPWIALLIALGLTSSWLFLRYTKPVYQSSSVLKIDEKTEAGLLGLGAGGSVEKRRPGANLEGEVELIKSNLIYRRLKDSLALDVNYYVEGTVLESELYTRSPFQVTYKIKNPAFYNRKFNVNFSSPTQFRLSYLEGEQEVSGVYSVGQPLNLAGLDLRLTTHGTYFDANALDAQFYFVILDEGTLNTYLNTNLSVQIVNPDANTVQISFKDFNPAKAQDIVNKIDTVYLQEKLAQKKKASDQSLQFLSEQADAFNNKLQLAEDNLQSFARENRTYDVRADAATVNGKILAQEEKRQNLLQKQGLLADLSSLVEQDQLTANEDSTVAQSIPGLAELEDGRLTQEIEALNDQQWDLRRVLRSYKETTEAVKQRRVQLDFTRSTIRRLLEQNKLLLQEQIEKMNRQRDELNAKLDGLPQKATQQARLQRPFELYEKTYVNLINKDLEFRLGQAGTTADFQILSPASLPSEPISPVRAMIYAIGLAGGIVLGLGLIAIRYFLHDTVTNTRELERMTSASLLGVIPTYDKEKMMVSKLVVNKNPKSAISESIRSIRTNLDFIGSSRKKRIISVTSTVSGEGKTFVTVNLGGIIALSEQRVVILDLDMRKPKVNLAFGGENARGISTILIEKHTIEECIQHTDIPTLDFISAGPTPPNPSELILNPKFDELLAELHQHYDVILIDTPPVGLVTDGILIMRKADIPLYIVRAGYSKKAFLKNINKLMRTNNFTRLSTILNDASATGLSGYSYGYGYGQGYYDEPTPPKGVISRLRQRIS